MNANEPVRMLKGAYFGKKRKSGEVWQDKAVEGETD